MFDFAGNRELKDLAGVPEQFRPFYKEAEGKYVLDSENPVVRGAVEAIVGQANALAASRQEAKGLQERIVDLSPLSEFGTDVESIKTGVTTKLEELRGQVKDGADIEAQLQRQREEMTTHHQGELQKLKDDNVSLVSQLETQIIDRETLEAVGSTADNPRLILPFVKSTVKTVVTENGNREVRVLNQNGDVRISGTTGLPMSVSELVKEMQGSKEYASLFRSEARPGSGHRPGTGGGGGTPNTANMSPNQKIAAGLPGFRRG
jgi:hypothetical protein